MDFLRLPISAHLAELRKRLITAVVAILLAWVLAYAFSRQIFALMTQPLSRSFPGEDPFLVFTALPEAFFAYLKVSFWVGLILAFPVVLFELWRFVSPGLYSHERRLARKFLLGALGLFVAGGLFGFLVVLPIILSFFLGFANQDLIALPRVESYLTFCAKLILTFGLIFEIPFLMYAAGRLGLVSREYFRRQRRMAWLSLYFLAAVMVPSDIFTQLLLAIPMILLYELGTQVVPKRLKEGQEERANQR
ncbi:twin-arginine translocase subunit TatC [Thermosulfuriphilus ammonigenes]|uniref:Sec-independent protein translocase protein TatC n=1 Tax=Thermosulfuriphilus ammonigenes TaxID=1936021 RepID=A0A6G7PUZ8_9BACT|nr:twin-arginine translocase subunit TatC [Thermosulfuriphilus ammonigenes]MBA2848337.1 sec-independent protein translocase protein TatC [Thermosulfuriphilus ammonigenes]QIJ71505.1 twin-arginine translocase subunit TatC [Thermosulfuriphilus ammonigenes]